MSSLDDALAAIWQRSRPVVAERLTTVEAAAQAASIPGGPDEASRREGIRAAHQLAGSLGTCGRHEGSDVARELEQQFAGAAEPGPVAELSARLRELLAPRLD